MLVKIKLAVDGRWVIQALSGEFRDSEVAIAKAVYLRNARMGEKHATGFLYGTWGVEIPPFVEGTQTLEYLMVRAEQPLAFVDEIYRNTEGKWFCGDEVVDKDLQELVADLEGLTGKVSTRRPAFRGIPVEPVKVKKESRNLVEKITDFWS